MALPIRTFNNVQTGEEDTYPQWRVDPEAPSGTATLSAQDAADAADSWFMCTLDSIAKNMGIKYVRGSRGIIEGTTDPGFTYYHNIIMQLVNCKKKKVRVAICSNIVAKMTAAERALFDKACSDLNVSVNLSNGRVSFT